MIFQLVLVVGTEVGKKAVCRSLQSRQLLMRNVLPKRQSTTIWKFYVVCVLPLAGPRLGESQLMNPAASWLGRLLFPLLLLKWCTSLIHGWALYDSSSIQLAVVPRGQAVACSGALVAICTRQRGFVLVGWKQGKQALRRRTVPKQQNLDLGTEARFFLFRHTMTRGVGHTSVVENPACMQL